MVIAGILVTLLGFIVSLASVEISSATGARLVIVCAGLVLSLVGIVGLLNRHYVRNAIWRK